MSGFQSLAEENFHTFQTFHTFVYVYLPKTKNIAWVCVDLSGKSLLLKTVQHWTHCES